MLWLLETEPGDVEARCSHAQTLKLSFGDFESTFSFRIARSTTRFAIGDILNGAQHDWLSEDSAQVLGCKGQA